MAAVAQSHAVEVSCPIVQREFLLWPDERRRLFGRLDNTVSPVSEISGTAVIEAESWEEREKNSWVVSLGAGPKTVRLGFLNDFYDEETQDDRNLILDEVIVRDREGTVVERIELETLLDHGDCRGPYWDDSRERLDGYGLRCNRWVDVPVYIPADGDFRIEVVAFQEPAGDGSAMLGIVVESDIDTSRGAMLIRNKLVELHEKLLGVTATVDSPEVEAAFRLFVEVWDQKRRGEDGQEELKCSIRDDLFFEGIAEDVLEYDEDGDVHFKDRVEEILEEVDWWGREGLHNPVIRAWTVVLAYFLMDYRYLFL